MSEHDYMHEDAVIACIDLVGRSGATDIQIDTGTVTIESGNYLVVCAAPCHLAGVQHYATGTSVLTVKGRNANLMDTTVVGGV
jgi:hypothetical protein